MTILGAMYHAQVLTQSPPVRRIPRVVVVALLGSACPPSPEPTDGGHTDAGGNECTEHGCDWARLPDGGDVRQPDGGLVCYC